MRRTRHDIAWAVRRITDTGLPVRTNTNATGWRLESYDGTIDISPRIQTKSAFYDWLLAFYDGILIGALLAAKHRL